MSLSDEVEILKSFFKIYFFNFSPSFSWSHCARDSTNLERCYADCRKLVDAAIEEARRVVDAQEMADMPHCQLDPVITDAGILHFCDRKDVSVALRNTGTVHMLDTITYPLYPITASSGYTALDFNRFNLNLERDQAVHTATVTFCAVPSQESWIAFQRCLLFSFRSNQPRSNQVKRSSSNR